LLPEAALCLCGFLLAASLLAHDPISTKLTWSREISRIVYNRCVGCHREGGSAPVPLVTYQQARPWAKSIKEQVLSRRMPLWGAVKGFGDFSNDRALSQEEINLIAAWVEGGAPEGDPALMPHLPEPVAPPPQASGRPVDVAGGGVLHEYFHLLAIEPVTSREIPWTLIKAQRPDGSIEPLLWLLDYRAALAMRYEYRHPIDLPEGTQITSDPPVSVRLIMK
jgi:mono/diheme cytochrome c family protein